MTRFFEPDNDFLRWIIKYANGRLIVDVGSGENHVPEGLRRLGANAIGIDMFSPEADLPMNFDSPIAKPLIANPATLKIICRPCHGDFPSNVFSLAQGEILYVGLERNVESDLEGIEAKLVEHEGTSKENERVWVIGTWEADTEAEYTIAYHERTDVIPQIYVGRVQEDGITFKHGASGSSFMFISEDMKLIPCPGMSYQEAMTYRYKLYPTSPGEWPRWEDNIYYLSTDKKNENPKGRACLSGFVSPTGEWYGITHRHEDTAYELMYQFYGESGDTIDLVRHGWIAVYNGAVYTADFDGRSLPKTITDEQKAFLRKIAQDCPIKKWKKGFLRICMVGGNKYTQREDV